jgi:hypothetical protein
MWKTATRCTLRVIRMCYEGDLRRLSRFNVEAGVPSTLLSQAPGSSARSYFPPITSFAIVANCMFDVPS